MFMGQVWSKAQFDGAQWGNNEGGRGSVLAVTAQNPGNDGKFGTADDLAAPLNFSPVDVSMDSAPGSDCHDPFDRVRGFMSLHVGGANFLMADGAVRFVGEEIEPAIYRGLSTIAGEEVLSGSDW